MPNQKKEYTTSIHMRINVDLLKELDSNAEKTGTNRTQLITNLIREYLEKSKNEEGIK